MLLAILSLFWPVPVFGQSTSSNYKVDQTFFGNGGELNACGSAYCAKQSTGETAVGNTTSTSYQAFAGFNTTDQPYLEFVVNSSTTDLGYLDTTSTSHTNATFTVRAWQSGGYVVRTQSDPPGNGSHNLTGLSSPTSPTAGTEQFGINLVANTVPAAFGADPVQSPDATFSNGIAAAGYATANSFKYVKGDVIASSSKSSSVTVYTVSYIYNISTETPNGLYSFHHNLVATATY
jgi:hypothetical protein